MYVYIRSEPVLYTVGFYSPDGQWHAESDHESDKRAAERVHYLNGGRSADEDDSGSWAEYQHIKAQQRTADYSDQCSSDLPF